MVDERTEFYMKTGWMSEAVANVFGAYEDDEVYVTDLFVRLDLYVHLLEEMTPQDKLQEARKALIDDEDEGG